MSAQAAEARVEPGSSIETPSGKGRSGENFPVGSWLIRRDLRSHVHAFYRFARNADDVADNPALAASEKLRRLDRMAAVLDGAANGSDAPAAAAMRASLAATGMTSAHCHDLLVAFRLDAEKRRYRDWDELMHYCRYSAASVGRQLLDLHRENRAAWPASDALCAALQVLNHLQDCALDYRRLDRVYLPQDDFAAAGGEIRALAADACTAGLRRVLDLMLDRTTMLLEQAQSLPQTVAAPGLRRECVVIAALAVRLCRRLRRADPLARRVALAKSDFLAAFFYGLWRGSRQ